MTTPLWLAALLALDVIGFGMVAGFFATFSDLVMPSLKRSRPEAAIEVMQVINREVFHSKTIFALWGMLGLSLVVAVAAVATQMPKGPLALVVAGCVAYFAGVLIVSRACNLPMNDLLASMRAADSEAMHYWQNEYLVRWVFWNSVRAVASAAAGTCFLLAGGWLMRGTS
jgi:uncharacterized membrane protein